MEDDGCGQHHTRNPVIRDPVDLHAYLWQKSREQQHEHRHRHDPVKEARGERMARNTFRQACDEFR